MSNKTKCHFIITIFFLLLYNSVCAQIEEDSLKIEKLRSESGIDPTRVMSRAGYSIIASNPTGPKALVGNRFSMNVGIGRWSISGKFEIGSKVGEQPGTGFETGLNDFKFSILNAFLVSGKHAMAGAVEFALPTGKPGIGLQYFSATPSLTYSYTIKPSLIFAVQPQYTFDLMKDELYPDLGVVTVRAFLAYFSPAGYFIVFEPRPIFDLENNKTDWVISPVFGKALGNGFNLITLVEIALTDNLKTNRGSLFQLGFNKNF
jgi:hypothetical protein